MLIIKLNFCTMSIEKRQIFLHFCLFLFITQFCFGVFPITNTLQRDDCKPSTLNIHTKLKDLIRVKRKANYFACAFNFIIIQSELSKKKVSPFVVHRNIRSSTKTIDKQRRVTVPTYRVRQHLLYLTENLVKKAKINNNFIKKIGFVGNDQGVFIFKSEKKAGTVKANYARIVKLQKAFYKFSQSEERSVKLLAGNLHTVNLRTASAPQNYSLVNTDSEAHAIVILQEREVIQSICKKVIDQLASNEYIVGIEFHGCTTRDMCTLCLTNFNILQYLALKSGSLSESFLGMLKQELIDAGKARSPFTVTTVISSLQEFPPIKHGGNGLWYLIYRPGSTPAKKSQRNPLIC